MGPARQLSALPGAVIVELSALHNPTTSMQVGLDNFGCRGTCFKVNFFV
jgi:hypothetical protein